MGCQATDAGQTPRKGMSCGPRALAASAAAVAVTLAVVVFAPSSPAILPMRVLVDGGGGGELVATVEAEYHDASWHSTGIDGGSCAVVTGALPVLRAAVLRPRSLGAERVSIDVVVTELWPTRVHQALQAGGVMECTLAAHVDIFRTGWRVERKLRWSLDASQGPATISVRPQQVKPGVEDGAVSANASYLFEAGLSPGSALGAFLRAVPVAVRAELGYVEESEGALQGHVAVDAELAVTTEAGTGRVVVAVPFTTRTSAPLSSLLRGIAAAGAAAPMGASERALVFAASPSAPATASLLGGLHTVAWSRNLSFTERPEHSRRLAVRRLLDMSQLPAVHDVRLLHRIRVDDKEALEVLVAVAGGDPAEATVSVRHAALSTGVFSSAAFTDLFSITVRTDMLLEPTASLGDLANYSTGAGTFARSKEGDTEVMRWSAAPDLGANITGRGEDFSISVLLPDRMTGELAMKGGALTGFLAMGDASLANLTGTLKQMAGSEDREFKGKVFIGEAPLQVSLTLKAPQNTGMEVLGSIINDNNTTEKMSVDAKFDVAASGDVSAHAKIDDSSSPSPELDFKLSVAVVEPACGRILSTLDLEGKRALGVDAGCTRSAGSDDVQAYAVVKTSDAEPAVVNASMDFDSDPVYGGKLAAFAEAGGKPLFKAWVLAGEGAQSRTLDLNLTTGEGSESSSLACMLQHSKPGAVDVAINGTVFADGAPLGEGSIQGKALDHVLSTQTAADGRREIVFARPGTWSASVSTPREGAMAELATLTASLNQVGSLLTLEVDVPALAGMTMLADSGVAGGVTVNTTVSTYGEASGASTKTTAMTILGRMNHAGQSASGPLLLAAGGTTVSLPLDVSRGFVPMPDSTYKFNASLSVDLTSSMGVFVNVDDAFVKTYADWSLAGVGWDLSLRDGRGVEQLTQGVDLGMALPAAAVGATRVTGSMKVQVEGDAAAFIADPMVKMGFRQLLAEIAGVPESAVKVTLSLARRLSETRRLAGAVRVDYEITPPAGADASAVASAISAMSSKDVAAKVTQKIAAAGGKVYAFTVTESSVPQVDGAAVRQAASGAPGLYASSVLLLAAAVTCAT